MRLAYVNVNKVTRNYVCSGKQNFYVHLLVDTVDCHSVTVCKICKSTCGHNNFTENFICNKKRHFHEHLSY